MAEFQLTNKAVEDLNAIWNYTVNRWSEKQADRYYQMLLDNCKEVAENPGLGKNYEGIALGLFEMKLPTASYGVSLRYCFSVSPQEAGYSPALPPLSALFDYPRPRGGVSRIKVNRHIIFYRKLTTTSLR